MSTKKHLRDLVAYARDLGVLDARVEQGGKHPHLVGTKPDGSGLRYVVPGSPSDGARGQRNARAELRRMAAVEREKAPAPAKAPRRRTPKPPPTVLDAVLLRRQMADAFEALGSGKSLQGARRPSTPAARP